MGRIFFLIFIVALSFFIFLRSASFVQAQVNFCGDSICSEAESCSICSTDCGECPTPPISTPTPTDEPTPTEEPTPTQSPPIDGPTPTQTNSEPHQTSIVTTNNLGCRDQSPETAPILTSLEPFDNKVKLNWISAGDPVTYYLIAYGTNKDFMQYGNPNVGGKQTISFTVSGLTNGIKYYFKVRGVNGCKPGKFSNKLSAVPGSKNNSSILPNLSIYKLVKSASLSAKEPEKKVAGFNTSVAGSSTCTTCAGWQLLVGEALLLFLYFFVSSRIRILSKAASVAIPVVFYFLFLQINGNCSAVSFSCKYFLQLSIIIYLITIIVHKNRSVHKKDFSVEYTTSKSFLGKL